MANFTASQATALFKAIQSYAQELGIFEGVNLHEPWNAPGNRLFCSINLGVIRPVQSSGLLGAVSQLMGAFSGGFSLSGTIRDIDLMAMSAQPSYVDFEGKPFRVIEISIGLVINDMWAEAA